MYLGLTTSSIVWTQQSDGQGNDDRFANDPPTCQFAIRTAVGLAQLQAWRLLLWRSALSVWLLQSLIATVAQTLGRFGKTRPARLKSLKSRSRPQPCAMRRTCRVCRSITNCALSVRRFFLPL
jgi:hypothetical protein